MVDNYSNTTGGANVSINQTTRPLAGILTTSANNEGAKISSVTCYLKNDGSYTGNFQCTVYDYDGTFLTQIGDNVDVSTLPASYAEYTFTATATQNADSKFSTGETGYIVFRIDGTGICDMEAYNTGSGTELFNALPKLSTTNGTTWDLMDSGNYYYFRGTVTFTVSTSSGLLNPPQVAYI